MVTYIIKSNGLYKIGKTVHLENRLSSYATHNPFFELIMKLEGDYESQLHTHFKDKHIKLEWFKLDDSDISSIGGIVTSWEPKKLKYSPEERVINKPMPKIVSKVHSIFIKKFGVYLSKEALEVCTYLALNHKVGVSISIPRSIRVEIGESYQISQGTVANALAELCEQTILYSIQRGVYKMNPRFFFKGSTSDRQSMLKTVLQLECPHC